MKKFIKTYWWVLTQPLYSVSLKAKILFPYYYLSPRVTLPIYKYEAVITKYGVDSKRRWTLAVTFKRPYRDRVGFTVQPGFTLVIKQFSLINFKFVIVHWQHITEEYYAYFYKNNLIYANRK
jgi:hypothetical protein